MFFGFGLAVIMFNINSIIRPDLMLALLIVLWFSLFSIGDVFSLTTEERIEKLELLLSRVKLEEVDGKISYIFGPETCTMPDGTIVQPCGVNVYGV
jgi:hypothetical protein